MKTKIFAPIAALALFFSFGAGVHAQTDITTTGTTATEVTTFGTPTAPNTGAGGSAATTMAVLTASGLAAAAGFVAMRRSQQA